MKQRNPWLIVDESPPGPSSGSAGLGRLYNVLAVPDAGNCFYECCAVFLKNAFTHVQLRQRLSGSAHLAPGERVRVGKLGEYATIEDITAMAKELNLTICVHQCSQASSKTVPHIVHSGAGGEMHVLFLYNPVDGLGHIMPMAPQG